MVAPSSIRRRMDDRSRRHPSMSNSERGRSVPGKASAPPPRSRGTAGRAQSDELPAEHALQNVPGQAGAAARRHQTIADTSVVASTEIGGRARSGAAMPETTHRAAPPSRGTAPVKGHDPANRQPWGCGRTCSCGRGHGRWRDGVKWRAGSQLNRHAGGVVGEQPLVARLDLVLLPFARRHKPRRPPRVRARDCGSAWRSRPSPAPLRFARSRRAAS